MRHGCRSNISRRMKELKHGEEDEIMCKSVEEYAERKAKEAAEKAAEEAAEKATKEATEKTDKRTVMELNHMGMGIEKIANVVHRDVKEIEAWLSK